MVAVDRAGDEITAQELDEIGAELCAVLERELAELDYRTMGAEELAVRLAVALVRETILGEPE